jgi:phosphate starvation-inducible protein PhoH
MSKKDTSQHIAQKDKVKDDFEIRKLKWTPKQEQIIQAALDKTTNIVILDGLPGTAKTLLSVYCSLELLKAKKISDIVYIRSLIQSTDGQTGFLTGDLDEKTFFYNVPLFDKLEELLNKSSIESLYKQERIKTYPVSLLRGYTFNVNSVILDEGQNMMFDSLVTAATRMGKFSKLFICGDSIMQNDLGKRSGFKEFCEIFQDQDSRDNGIQYFKLGQEDIMRSGIVRFIVDKITKYKEIIH